jgi:hypothetical protein
VARLGQALGNLLGNAVQHGGAGGRITVTVRGGDSAVTIAVHNGGAAIPAGQLDGIFNPMKARQTPRPAAERGPTASLGLGLYIAERIVVAHGGRLAVSSSDACGDGVHRRPPTRRATRRATRRGTPDGRRTATTRTRDERAAAGARAGLSGPVSPPPGVGGISELADEPDLRLQPVPVCSSTACCAMAISSRTSRAVAAPRLTMMFACSGEICAPPCRCPLSPAWSTSRPAPTPSSFLKIDPALGWICSHGWRAPRQLRFSCRHAVHPVHVAARQAEGRREHDVAAVVEHGVVVAELHVVGGRRSAARSPR